MKNSVCFIVWVFLFFGVKTASAAACVELADATVIGQAVEQKGDKTLYCEYHFVEQYDENIPLRVRVEYYDTDQNKIAVKKVDYSQSQISPDIKQNDLRHGETISIKKSNDKPALLLAYIPPADESLQEKTVSYDESTVVDAGFDYFIKARWDDIILNKRVRLTFVSAALQTTINLMVKRGSLGDCTNAVNDVGQYSNGDYECFFVRPSNTFLNWLVKPIKLVYQKKSKRLVLFNGAVNVTGAEGQSQSAMITYRYIDE